MSYSLKIDLFLFNSKTDFLPCYKTLHVKVNKNVTLFDLLSDNIAELERNYNLPKNKNLAIKINNTVVFLDTPIKNIIEKLNTQNFTIEPISEYRVNHDLDINTDDFYAKLELFGKFLDKNDKKEYEKLISYYYASAAYEFEKEYFGDSFFILADKLIKKYPQNKKEILEIIANKKFGIWLHVNLKNILFDDEKADEIESIITNLKKEIFKTIPNVNKLVKFQYEQLISL